MAENDIVASVGSKGDSYDNALVESFNSLYKWELIYKQGPWRGLDDVEFATMTYVDWFNHQRLHGETTGNASYVTQPSTKQSSTISKHRRQKQSPANNPSSHQTRGASRRGQHENCHQHGLDNQDQATTTAR